MSVGNTVHADTKASGTADAGLTALNQAARRLKGIAQGKRRNGRTRDLVGLLLAHGSRAWRSSHPQVTVRIRVGSADVAAVRLAFGQP